MKATSLEPVFLNARADISPYMRLLDGGLPQSLLRHKLSGKPLAVVIDVMRSFAASLVNRGDTAEAIGTLQRLDALLARRQSPELGDLHAAGKQLAASLLIEVGDIAGALATIAATLTLLSANPRRKDGNFLCILAMLLYDLAFIHNQQKEFKQAERDIGKTLKIFEKLSKTDPARYGAAHIMSLNASTSIYRSKVEQVKLLAQYQAVTSSCLEMVNSGVAEATSRLVISLKNEGDTLCKMGRSREAVHFYTRALRYLTHIQPSFSLEQLQISISLGDVLLRRSLTRDKGVHLLNTMLHKAAKLNAAAEHRQIVDILLNAKSNSLEILSFWHKLFPK